MTDECELNFRFGWRWLVPLRNDDRVCLAGFREDEKAFWRRVLIPNSITDSTDGSNVWLINADHNGHIPDDIFPDFSRAKVVCVIGSNRAVSRWRQPMSRQFPVLREYGLLPPGNPRVIIPLELPRHVEAALRFHRPGRHLARFAILAARVMAYMGQYGLLRRKVLCIALRDDACLPMGAESAGLNARLSETRGMFALYLGTPVRNRKTVILPINDSPQFVLKMAESPDARRALENELSVLRALAPSLLAPNVPAVLDVVECGGTLTIYQEYRQRSLVRSPRYRQAVVDFLFRLSSQENKCLSLTSILNEDWMEWNALKDGSCRWMFPTIMRRLDHAAIEGMMVWVHRSHGDFAPWNCAWTKKGLFVFDWEESQERALAFGDAFYFVVAPAVHVIRQPDPVRVTCEALGLAAEICTKAGLTVEDLKIYWGLWLLKRASKDKQPLYGRLLVELEKQWG